MTIDLSFTGDQEWIRRREILWKPFGKMLKKDFGVDVERNIHHYFLTGELCNGEPDHDGARFSYFPLCSFEGWDYVLQNLVRDSGVFEDKFYASLRSQEGRFESEDQELAIWDYFHPKIYQPVIKSRVPVGRKKDIVEFEVDVYRAAENIANGLRGYFEYESYGLWPKWCQRIDYFFSFLPHLIYDKNKKYRRRDPIQLCYTQVRLLFTILYDESYWAKVEDPENHRGKFADHFKKRFESLNNLPERMLELWEEVKNRSAK